jgi:hypothetical protein
MNVQPIHHVFQNLRPLYPYVSPHDQKETHLEGLETIPSVAELPFPTETSISIITPPKVR